jgi:hypothetical protein
MDVTFLSPEAALVGLAVALPLLSLARAESRARVARTVLGLPDPLARGWPYVAAIAAFAGLVALGAAQPVIEDERARSVRSDAEAFFVFDTTRSMQASAAPDTDTRFERARVLGKRMRSELPELRVGVASLTDRLLPHLFPTGSEHSFRITLDRSVGVERPASIQRGNALASSLDAFDGLRRSQYFAPGARQRMLVVFTDAETRPLNTRRLRRAFQNSRIATVLVRIGSGDERVFVNGAADLRYRPLPGAANAANTFAEATGGRAFDEDELEDAIATARRAMQGEGPRTETTEVEPTPLAAYAFGAAFLPLAFLLWRRNVR